MRNDTKARRLALAGMLSMMATGGTATYRETGQLLYPESGQQDEQRGEWPDTPREQAVEKDRPTTP